MGDAKASLSRQASKAKSPKAAATGNDQAQAPVKAPENDWKGDRAVRYVMKHRLVISPAGFVGLKNYGYSGGDYTPLDNIFNKEIWIPVAKRLPPWIAPNLITLFGLMWVFLSFLALVLSCPDFQGRAPWYVYLFAAVCVFAYQTLDAIDGKQARETKSSSALGQLFDHGCDSASTTFLTLSVATTMNLGVSWETMLLLSSVQLPFFLAQWQEYHTHVLVHAMGWMGVTEAQLLTMSIHLLAALFGPGFYGVQLGPLRLNQWIVATQIVLGCYVTFNTFSTVFSKAANKLEAVLQLVPVVGLVCGGFLWASWLSDPSHATAYRRHSTLTTCMLGLLFTHLSNQIIVCALCRMKYPTQWLMLPFPLLLAMDYFRVWQSQADIVLGGYLGLVVFSMALYIHYFIEEITHFLGIHCLTLGPRTEPTDSSE